ncbi:ribosome small subunit-dependent GTPase A [Lactiplantibacillus mudanjiangensis]|uniref:Small ribosomal subunit biogenesis GTPase RsgA n=1 Tax=Lactiplantibacillus mudanjiangensis TaxID=1296538 RepID=A0A660E125_9LACO|nr:ribosome small subunit-dependent GTPase A [Lactiplantibacillus mudanjiangensis]VDG19799.1 translation factor, GTPase (putative) [Lactobacillus plantarum JDM1] [Lactiplantibacillus mudanjiangensis]VDG24520.1 translation factor, GTPase (putative) [Lactobacillus plantarum JDM1] [Lactiplantibacillus mudanjiangensis]VDG29811.1 translation factor, GTPase (putative) [Lactobacillus plantarum JDM1] [Lactiplantibacillus mudanjiangensis]VDG31225.1 translation factor, GTPase (putative) [Lactobacillus pl
MKIGQIRQSLSGFYDVYADGQLYRTRARGNFRKRRLTPLVGDQVEFDSTTPKEGYILKLLARKTELVRPPVANVNLAIVVTATTSKEFSTNLLDRQLVALEVAGIEPVVYMAKTDLLSDDEYAERAELAAAYQKIGYQVIIDRQAFSEPALAAVKTVLAGHLAVVMGQTGAGKSTLLNHLQPGLDLATGEISQALNRGKHTTRKVSLIEIAGGLVADTPGFSSYEVFDIPANELTHYFPEFVRLGVDCKYRGCVHINEPKCAVKAALDAGDVLASRYDNYLQFYETIKNKKIIYNKKK